MASPTSSISSSLSSSSGALVSSSCACYGGKPPSAENMKHFAGFGSSALVRAMLCHFPVLKRLSVLSFHNQMGGIAARELSSLIQKKQLIVFVKELLLSSSTSPVAALVVLTENIICQEDASLYSPGCGPHELCNHLRHQIGHIYYVPHNDKTSTSQNLCRATIIRKAPANDCGEISCSSTSGPLFFDLEDSCFTKLISKDPNLQTYCRFAPCGRGFLTSSNTILASREFVCESIPLGFDKSELRKITIEVENLPENTTISYLCPPVDFAPLDKIERAVVSLTVLPRDITAIICSFFGSW